MKNFLLFLRTLNRQAALESLKDVLAVVGLATLLGDFTTMPAWFVAPGLTILVLVWYADYLRRDVHAVPYDEGDPKMLRQIAELGQ